MKRIVIFFSDIMGTILGSIPNQIEDYHKFNELLTTIKEKEEADEIIFSLISTDNKDLVASVHNQISNFISDSVVFGRQFFENGYYIDDETVISKQILGKALEIQNYVQSLEEKNEIVSVYFADDVEMYHQMLMIFADKTLWGEKLHSIRPNQNIGLSETNALLENNLNERFCR